MENHKDFELQLKMITEIEDLDNTSIKIVENENCIGKLTKEGKDIKIEIEGTFSNYNSDEISVSINNQDFILKSPDFNLSTSDNDFFSKVYCTHNLDIREIRTSKFDEDKFSKFKCFIPTNKNYLDGFRFQIENIIYSDNKSRYSAKCVRITVENIEYDILQITNLNQGYYVIENLKETSLQQFKKVHFAIQQALGFFTGLMPSGEEYIFSKENFKYTNYLRPSLKSIYYPVYTNPYSLLNDYKEEAEKYYKKLTIVPAEVVSNLVKKIIDCDELSSTIILLMEATNVKSLLIMPSVFAVIIEALSKIISIKEDDEIIPIENKKQEVFIISELSKVIDHNSNNLSDDSILKLKRRLNEINRPIIKKRLTNNEKLTQPFEQLNIKLTLDDIKAIEHRNDLLHGNIHLEKEEKLTTQEVNEYMLYISGKLYTLLSKLILKSVNYNGFVINYAKLHSKHAKEEEFFEEI